jgi:hypothetical protein
MSAPPAHPRTLADVKGWFMPVDQRLFAHFLTPDAVAPKGDVVEIGAYLGKSAIVIGRHLREGERFTVCDLFGDDVDDTANRRENKKSYRNLTREKFESNYLAFHPELPTVVQAPSSQILEHVAPGSARFVHVDGSHLYDHVAEDIRSARTMALPGAVIAFDDYRSPHTPGTALAIWEAVLTQDLRVVALTPRKLYAVFGDPAPHHERLRAWLEQTPEVRWEQVELRGETALRVWQPRNAQAAEQAEAPPSLATNLKCKIRRLSGKSRPGSN